MPCLAWATMGTDLIPRGEQIAELLVFLRESITTIIKLIVMQSKRCFPISD